MTTAPMMVTDRTPEPIEEALRKIAKVIRRYPQEDRDLFNRMFVVAITTNEKEECEQAFRTMVEIMRDNDGEEIAEIARLVLPDASDEEQKPKDARLRSWTEHVAGRIRRFREEKGWTQAQLADEAGLTQSHVSRIEKAVHSPSYKTIAKIAAALGKSHGEIDPVD